MAQILNLNFLKKIPQNIGNKELSSIFFRVVDELKIFLDINSIENNIKIEFQESINSEDNKNILDLGVSRTFLNNKINIRIRKDFRDFLPIIILREAYLTFFPFSLSRNENIKIFINQIVELHFQKLKIMDKWKEKTSEKYVSYEYLESQYNTLKDFFDLKLKEEEIDSAVKFFFQYLRNNPSVFEKDHKDLYDIIFKNFVYKTSRSINNDDIIETIRILIRIFYREKIYRFLVDYKNFFLEYKRKNILETDLSLRNFIKNLRWIKEFTYIGPSYQVNWRLTGLHVFFCSLSFNANLSKIEINKFTSNLPFYYQSSSSENNFSIKLYGWFIIPYKYQNDLFSLFRRLKSLGYLNDILLIEETEHHNFLNLNYFRENFQAKKGIIDINHRAYDKKYEIFFKMEYLKASKKRNLSILDFIVLDRVRYYSIAGLSFDQRNEALKALKSDLIYEIISQKKDIKNLKESVKKIRESKEILTKFITFIENNKDFGFFYIKEILVNLIDSTENIIELIHKNNLKRLYDLRELLRKKKISNNLNLNLSLKNNTIRNRIFKDLFPDFFTNKKKFMKKKEELEIFKNFLSSCENLRIYKLQSILRIIQEKNLINLIFITKEEKLEKSYQKNILLDFSKEDLQKKLDDYAFSDPPLIKPILISTISVGTFAKYYLQIVTKKNNNTLEMWDDIKSYFPRIFHNYGNSYLSETDTLSTHLWLYNITSYEKFEFISILFNLFQGNLISLRRFFFDGFFKPYSRKDFYDFEKSEFFYTEDLFDQFFKYTKATFGKKQEKYKYRKNNRESLFWNKKKTNFDWLINEINNRISREKIDFSYSKFEKIKNVHQNLKSVLLDNERLNLVNKEHFFQKYIDHIYFIPNYQKFGFASYFLYLTPSNLNEIDFKLLFINTFDQVKYPGYIDRSKSLFIKYFFPYRNPNSSYLNWLTKAKKIINEYCLFYLKKVYQLFHFDYNIGPEGWDLNPNRFTSFYQNIVFDSKYSLKPSPIKEYQVGNLRTSEKYPPSTEEYRILRDLYAYQKQDLKTILSLRNVSDIKNVELLLKKNLIFPYIDLQNLGLIETLVIILPDVSKEIIPQIIRIFSIFNLGFIYETEGSYYIRGYQDAKNFEHGLV
ncbi:MAG: hypothetical protein GF311_06655, partial [Candidatus Lokiarchaeota archaeon]|nr:hypothetical protein [Candidatus Lokiarchaeota archaeon]